MKIPAYLLTVFIILLASSSCQQQRDERERLLYGDWDMVTWVINETGRDRNHLQMDFTFREDGTYLVDYGDLKEEGEFYLKRDELFTTETGMAEKMVKVLKLNADTLEFLMNRSGQLETVLLMKE